MRTQNCESRIDSHLADRLGDLRRLWTAWCNGNDTDDGESLADYGLCFDFVAPDTFTDQKEAYFRYQLSWGGPSDEFRFFINPDLSCHRIEFWFLDWFDGAHRVLSGENQQFLLAIWQWFRDCGACVPAGEGVAS